MGSLATFQSLPGTPPPDAKLEKRPNVVCGVPVDEEDDDPPQQSDVNDDDAGPSILENTRTEVNYHACDNKPAAAAAAAADNGETSPSSPSRKPKGKSRKERGANGPTDQDTDTESTLDYNSFAAPGLDASFRSLSSSSVGGPGSDRYITLGKAAFHIFKGNVGAGVFLLPTYYQDAGYVLGVLCVMVLGALMIDCALALLHAKHTIHHTEVRTYPAVVQFVLGDWCQYFTKFALIFTQFGFCIMYVQYASSLFAALVDLGPYSYQLFVLFSVAAVTPMTFLSNKMELLAYASLIAGVFVGVVLAGTTVVDVEHIAGNGVAVGVAAVVPTARLLVFLSGHMFSLEGIGVVLPVENSLSHDDRPKFGLVVRRTLVGIVALYIVFGVLGYVAYGETLKTSVVLALPAGWMKKLMQCLLGLSLIFGYPIQYVPAIQLVDKSLGVNLRRDRMKALLVRVALNVLFGAIALFIGGDTINIFASFLGAFAGVHLMITIPSLLALQLDAAVDPQRETLSSMEYYMTMFRQPLTARRVRFFTYLALAVIVWIGGLYFTFVSVFTGSITAG